MKLLRVILILILLGSVSGCEKFMYNVHSANYGKYGITIIEYPSRALMKKQGTGIPGVRGDIRWIPSFYDNRDQLPEDKVEIVWQLNELTNCERPIEGKSRNSISRDLHPKILLHMDSSS